MYSFPSHIFPNVDEDAPMISSISALGASVHMGHHILNVLSHWKNINATKAKGNITQLDKIGMNTDDRAETTETLEDLIKR